MRVSVLFGIFVPSIFYFLVPIAVGWFGATAEELVQLSFEFISPIFIGSLFNCSFLTLSGSLYAEGRTIYVGLTTLISNIICVLVIIPLFLYGFKLGILWVGIANILSDVIQFFFFLYCFFTVNMILSLIGDNFLINLIQIQGKSFVLDFLNLLQIYHIVHLEF